MTSGPDIVRIAKILYIIVAFAGGLLLQEARPVSYVAAQTKADEPYRLSQIEKRLDSQDQHLATADTRRDDLRTEVVNLIATNDAKHTQKEEELGRTSTMIISFASGISCALGTLQVVGMLKQPPAQSSPIPSSGG